MQAIGPQQGCYEAPHHRFAPPIIEGPTLGGGRSSLSEVLAFFFLAYRMMGYVG